MTETEALELIGIMTVFDRRDWSDAQINAWTAMLRTHLAEPGRKATEHLVAHKQPRDWSVATWREAYAMAARNEPVALPRAQSERGVTLDEHLAALAEAESPEAKAELGIWRRYARRRLIGDVL